MDVAEHGSHSSEDEHVGISQNKSFNWNYVRDHFQRSRCNYLVQSMVKKAAALIEGLVN